MTQKLIHKLRGISNRARQHRHIHNFQCEIRIPSQNFEWRAETEKAALPFFIASTTKLFTSAVVFQLIEKEKLKLETLAVDILGRNIMAGVHTVDGKDFSEQITIRHLLSHTSGLADYFGQKPFTGKSIGAAILSNQDMAWSFEDILLRVRKNLAPRFEPQSGRAFYSDTNYQLLGRIVEIITGKTFAAALTERVLQPLALKDTYMFGQETMHRYPEIAQLYHGHLPLWIPQAMASFGCDGGMVSTTTDLLRFLRAFFSGELFPQKHVDTGQTWRRIFFPLQYGVGLMRFQLPRVMTLFRRTPEFFGHSGASGTVLFYAPEKDLYVCAAVNQTKYRDLPYRLLVEVGMA